MNFRQLQTFVEIVSLGSFAAAAKKLNATQSTISARIQELEQDLGVTLFDRSQRKATVTAKGRELVGYAERALALQDDIRRHIGPSQELSGLVRVGVAELVAMTWLPRFAATLRERYPQVTLELDISLTSPLRSRLVSGDLDIAFIPGPAFDVGLITRSLGEVQFTWMAGKGFPLGERPMVASNFAELRILSLGENSVHFETVSSWLAESGSTQRPDLCNSMTVLAMLTAAGVGVSLLPPMCYASELASGELVIVPSSPKPPRMPFSVVYKARKMTALQSAIAELAAEVSTFDPTEPNA
ncbi:DNA-binding transcriptional LysR family regulator [Methylopila capsulata]|uniref:DNA-binding transcriptional LysR family regulator n=1 Tax=Methylopila capsulata TaxID=61654 RepID=A0A9W6IWF6_9HYPH|nr:LysR family transcriptional regulator [Methylopila capsulata]MBM7852209.1 DNA-binding transcriptional LysR family regulator [Methylopila capsulata]GLK56415.1 transcriptional regulator [Methylopila capsulata]